MRKKRLLGSVVILFVILACSVVTAFAIPNIYQQVTAWAEQETNDRKQEIYHNLLDAREEQLVQLIADTENVLTDSAINVKENGNLVKEDTKYKVQNSYQSYIDKLEQSRAIMQMNIELDFDTLLESLRMQTSENLQINDEEIGKALEVISETEPEKTLLSSEVLEEEIKTTLSTIKELEAIYQKEENPLIKEYILDNINLLNELIQILNE